MQVRAYGLFLSDIAVRTQPASPPEAAAAQQLVALAERCAAVGPEGRPRFAAVVDELAQLRQKLQGQ